MSTFERVKTIVVDLMAVGDKAEFAAKVTPDATIGTDLGVDSLDAMLIVMECEDEFGIEIPDSVLESIATVADLVAAVERLSP